MTTVPAMKAVSRAIARCEADLLEARLKYAEGCESLASALLHAADRAKRNIYVEDSILRTSTLATIDSQAVRFRTLESQLAELRDVVYQIEGK